MKRLTTLAIAVSLALLSGCARHTMVDKAEPTLSPNTVQRPSVNVQFATLVREPISGTISASGTVVSDGGAQANLSFPTDGQIANIYVNVGDTVSAGQVLASLDSRTAQSAIEQSQADVAAASAALARAAAGARPQEVQSNSALVGGAQAKADSARAELRRQESLAAAGIASRRDLEQARASYGDALAELRSKQAEGSLLLAGPRPQDVNLARAQLQQAQAGLAAARTKASLLIIVAPFSGTITARLKNPGESVDPTAQVLTMVNPQKSLVEVQLSEDQVTAVHVGDPATLTLNGTQRAIPARVEVVNSAYGNDTRTLSARIRPLGTALTPGASATATITVSTLRSTFVVPESAVVKDPDTGAPLVFVPTGNGRYRKIQVQIALQSGKRVAITGNGLREGDRVVTQGAYELLPFASGSDSG
ncbi:MAG: efflux RND transporter periplasmic adaptor subunit [Candidatus Eremiobacteraeota bacterium]|nr:efflux RND transporter periplasmic adaptor subunit [Candidatus Eremiobacteraeota bacterium]